MSPGARELLSGIAAFDPGPGAVQLPELCRALRRALGLRWLRITLADGSGFTAPDPVPAGRRRVHRAPLWAGDRLVGELTAGLPRCWWARRWRRRLLPDATDLLGPVLASASARRELDESLETARGHAERVAAMRRRIFAERDDERRAIERDLHDGAQHHLVALGMTLGLVELSASRDDPEALLRQLHRMRDGLDKAEVALVGTVTEGSPLLAVAGIQAALGAEFDGTPVVLDVGDWDEARRFESVVELAVYYICLEAANNARKHAPGADVVVRLAEIAEGLEFSVTDNGPGMGGSGPGKETSGVANMRRRVTAAGGYLQVRTAAGAGTVVQGFIPL